MSKKGILEYEELVPHLKYITNKKDLDKIKQAYDYAAQKHAGQFRHSGEPYVTHPLNVALILSSLEFDKDCIITSLLHDVVEDTDATIEEVKNLFGTEVSLLIDNLSKIEPLQFKSKSEQLANYQRNLLVSLVKDPRIIIIKLCDRLHNMRTLNACSKEKQVRVAQETLEIYTPLAHRLGIYNIKSELEDLALRYTNPNMFYSIAEKLNSKKQEREENVDQMMKEVKAILQKNKVKSSIKGRAKTIYSIYKKLEKGKTFSDIYDLLALRIIVESVGDCYTCLGLIHDKYKLVPNRFKDYISRPKTNMYQSLHTAVFGPGGQIFEIQIRTKEMDLIAEDGIASHWAYKEGKTANKKVNATDMKLQFFKSIIELDNDTINNQDFISSIKEDVLADKNIYVYTPKGDVFELPIGSTPIDFAYKIHTDVGNKMVSAIVNGAIVSFDYVLKTGDIINIKTTGNAIPNIDWVNIAKTTSAKNKIKNYFMKLNKEETLERNKELLDKTLKEKEIDYKNFYKEENIKKLIKLFKVKNFDELLISISSKNSPSLIIKRFEEKIEKNIKKEITTTKKESDSSKAIIVSGIDDIKVVIAECCKPLPNDNIIGYVSSGKGIIIHRQSCHNVLEIEDKLVDVSWNSNYKGRFVTTVVIEMYEGNKNLVNIVNNMNNHSILLKNMKNISLSNPIIYELELLVTSLEQLDKFIKHTKKNKNIKRLERIYT